MEMLEKMKMRRSIRKYRKVPVEREKLEMIMEAGLYAPNPGGDDVTLWGDAPAPGGTVTLPRLALNAYFLFALALLTLLILLRLALGRTAAASVLTRVALLPLCYLAAQLAIKGSSFTTYTLQRDFSLIALLTLCLYLALLAVHALWRQRRKAN